MKRIRTEHDIKPISEFRANAASLIQRVQDEKRPLVLTQHGYSAAVLLAVSEYDALLEELELLRELARAEAEVERGEVRSHEDALAHVLDGQE